MAEAKPAADAMTPYQLLFPKEAAKEIVVESAIPKDERLWVPQAENVWFRPLCLNVSTGYWMNLLHVRKSGVLSRHRHPQAVHGMVLKGRWRYLEHDWEATEGSYVFEPPGKTHTLYVPELAGSCVSGFGFDAGVVLSVFLVCLGWLISLSLLATARGGR